jgi:hypothetical protein
MSVDVAYPIFHTSDPTQALRVGRRLLTVADRQGARVCVDVELTTVEDVLDASRALPDAWFRKEDTEDWVRDPSDPTGLHCGVHAPLLSTEPAFLSAHLPLWASMSDQPVGGVEDRFTAMAGRHVAEIHWSSLVWPAVPERGLYAESNHAEVSVLFNTATRELDERGDGHTVLVHVRRGGDKEYQESHAAWLAEQIGRTVIGPPQPS